MKRILLALVACLLAFCASAQQVVLDDWQSLRIEFNTDAVRVDTVIAEGRQWATLSFAGSMPAGEVGDPMLPVYSVLAEVPLCKDIKLKVVEAEYETIDVALPLLPMQPSRSKSDTTHHKLIVNADAYSHSNMQGVGCENIVEAIGIARDRRLARIQYAPVVYVPATGKIIVCRKATVTMEYAGADREATLAMFERYHSPAFGSGANVINNLYPKSVRTAAPVRYLIVAHSMFRGQMDEFVQWKRRKGFITDIVYTNDPGVGTTSTAIQSYIQSQYTNATTTNPAPTYLLLVGDVEQIPSFTGTTDNSHITDLYFTTWTSGDHLPDCYYGRFSAQNDGQLAPQIAKTLMYEQYTFADPSFLDRAVMVAGVDGGSSGDYGYTHADPAMDYAIVNYINGAHGWSDIRYFKNNTSIVPSGATNVTIDGNASSMSATVRSYYNQGAGWINYSAHGSATSWGTPNFTTSHAAAMTNTQKFGIMIGNCCLTNKFETTTCLGEAVLRRGNYSGAVGYIGGSNSTYWNEDFYWAVGLRSGIGPSMSMAYNSSNLGAYDRVCHTHNEAYSQWVTSQGSLMMMGNMAVESSSSSRKHYYWEIYHLMGDPSLMPYLTQANTMTLTAPQTIIYGTSSLSVTAAPYAYVAVTDTITHTLYAATYANGAGQATLSLPTNMPLGGYEIAASAQQYRTTFSPLTVINPTVPFPIVTSVVPAATLLPGDTVALAVTVENPGAVTAHNVVAHLTSSHPALALLNDSIYIDSLPAGGSLTLTNHFLAAVNITATDGLEISLNNTATWTGTTTPSVSSVMLTIMAPKLQVHYSPDILSLQPGDSLTLTVSIQNNGHATLPAGTLMLTSPTALVTVGNAVSIPAMAPGASVTRQFSIHPSSTIPGNVTIPLAMVLDGPMPVLNETLDLYVGQPWYETFDGSFTLSGWNGGGNLPWSLTDSTAWQGTHSARSAQGLDHSQSSQLTLTATFAVADSITFRYAVSSEGNYDKFHFLLDGTDMITASGDIEWTRAAFPVTAGTHTLSFTYVKDYSVSHGHDCAWIDMLTLPRLSRPISFSTDTLCQGQIYVNGGDTVPTSQPGTISQAHVVGNTVTINDYTVMPASSSVVAYEACDSYTWNGVLYTESFDTIATYTNVYGCDSTSGVSITIHHSSSETQLVEGCDSCLWNGTYYTASCNLSGSYTDIYGCDSIVTIKIRIYHPVFSVDSVQTTESTYTWNGETYTESGTYVAVLSTVHGCDSTVTLFLTIDTIAEGLPVIDMIDVSAYPNPATGRLSFSREVEECLIYDMEGRLMAKYGSTQHIDISTLPRGVYMLKVTAAEGTALLRVVLR